MPLTTGEEAVCLLLDRMNDLEIEYMVVGSFSSNAYGIARATKDADFVVQTDEDSRSQLHSKSRRAIQGARTAPLLGEQKNTNSNH